jgi:hypothetical protein
VLNADDELAERLGARLACRVAYYSLDKNNKQLEQHREAGGLSATIEDGSIILYEGKERISLFADLPKEYPGEYMLPAMLVAHLMGFKPANVQQVLQVFHNGEHLSV